MLCSLQIQNYKLNTRLDQLLEQVVQLQVQNSVVKEGFYKVRIQNQRLKKEFDCSVEKSNLLGKQNQRLASLLQQNQSALIKQKQQNKLLVDKLTQQQKLNIKLNTSHHSTKQLCEQLTCKLLKLQQNILNLQRTTQKKQLQNIKLLDKLQQNQQITILLKNENSKLVYKVEEMESFKDMCHNQQLELEEIIGCVDILKNNNQQLQKQNTLLLTQLNFKNTQLSQLQSRIHHIQLNYL